MQSDARQDLKPQANLPSSPEPQVRPRVVGIGGSAGALPALITLLESLEATPSLAIVVVLHLSPDHESEAVEILQRVTPLVVTQVRSRIQLECGHIYVIAPGMNLITDDGHVQPATASAERPSTVIDLFFRSLAKTYRERAVGIILSGTGVDGSSGLATIKEYGGLTIAQSPDDCEHADMPRAAIGTGSVDLVLKAVEIGKRLATLAAFAPRLRHADGESSELVYNATASADEDQSAEHALHEVLAMLRVSTKHDFRNYKRATVLRRIDRRIQVNAFPDILAYRDFLRTSRSEMESLLADMLISVTNFFRDPRAFDSLQREVIAPLIKNLSPGEEARVWVPGCASGEESYSVAILMQECADQMTHAPGFQIFASDINEAALNFARAGTYPVNVEADISQARLRKFFEAEEGPRYRVRSNIRETILFARHNLLGDPPFSRLDLICCRNLLIYLDQTAQANVLRTFAYALKPGGYLFLGNAESIDAAGPIFEPIDKEHRVFRLRSDAGIALYPRVPARMPVPDRSLARGAAAGPNSKGRLQAESALATLHERALLDASPPSVLINAELEIERVSPGAGRFVAFAEGVPSRNVLKNVPPDIRVELHSAIFRANTSKQAVRTLFRRNRDGIGAGLLLALSVVPVLEDEHISHWLVIFDSSVENGLCADVDASTTTGWQETSLAQLTDENRELKVHLQDTLDRSAVANEELKASNEELQTINEELRSAKEELETSKEELQSVNEELTTVNFELRMKVDEAGRNNDDLRNLMEASDIATVFVDSAMRVKRFTPQACKLFPLIPSDIGRSLLDVQSRLRYDEMVEDATAAFQQLVPVERRVTAGVDEHYLARVLPYRTSQDMIGGAVLTFINMTELRRAENRVRLSEERLRDAIASSSDFAVISTDGQGQIVTWNEGAAKMFGYEPDDIMGQPIDVLFTADDRARGMPKQEREVASRDGRAYDERWHLRRDGTQFFCSGIMAPLHVSDGSGYLKIARDMSEAKERERQRDSELHEERQAAALLKSGSELKDRFLAVVSHELKQPLNLIQVNAELLVRLPEAKNSATVQRVGTTIMHAVSTQETIVNDLLDLSRVQTGKMRIETAATDLTEIVRRVTQALATDAERKKIKLEVRIPDVLICHCDPVRIEQVIWNLLGNAFKFTPPGGCVSLALSSDDSEAKIEVSDTGIGISPKFLPHVFELFSQGMAGETSGVRRQGLGIGLALVRELVQAHGGRIEVRSAGDDQGTTFTIWLALQSQAAPSREPVEPSDFAHRVLLVDDDDDSRMVFAELLRLEGAEVDAASTGAEALQLASYGDYDLLLSDIGMPEMSGLELVRKIRALEHGARIYCIAVTGFGGETDVQRALDAGFDAHVSKPVSLERLTAALKNR